MATIAVADSDPSKSTKDPLATHLIPETICDRRYENEGRTLSYKRGKLLGKGGFAKVFASTLMPGRAQYAIKIVAKSSLQKVRAQQKLQTEIKIHKALRHTNVVKFERFFDDSSFYFIVMELCDFNSMSELLKRRKKLSEPEARFYMAQIVESLQYLHSHLVIHRDLKLGNLFIDSNMCIKVGDFGLATQLSYPDERRKTICGTPNYIAPEILEGKSGHSFEVDIWSSGVILYTLLVGKPPFESKDVKSTYKRILANSYAFPEHTPVSSDAKNLIRKMLQARPDHRPPLKHIAAHPFFSRPTAYMPSSLPESALHECPRLVQMTEFVQSSAAYNLKEEAVNENYFSSGNAAKGSTSSGTVGPNNENDPNTINRMNIQQDQVVSGLKIGGEGPRTRSSAGLKSTVPGGLGQDVSAACSGTAKSSSATAMQMLSSARQSSSVRSQSTAPLVSSAAIYKVSSSAPTVQQSERSKTSHSSSTSTAVSSSSTRPSSRGHFNNQGSTSAGYAQKFDIYVDSKPAQSSLSTQQAGRKRDASDAVQGDDALDRRAALRGKALIEDSLPVTVAAPQLGSSGNRYNCGMDQKTRYELDIDQINSEMEHVHIADQRTRAPNSNRPAISTPPAAAPTARDAWAWNDKQDVFPASHVVDSEVPAKHMSTPAPHNTEYPAPAAESEAICISTPQDQIISTKDSKPLGTLETMHEMLNNSFSVMDGPAANVVSRGRWSTDNITSTSPSSPLVANVWVVRYVDYTSKYGLGFLFNTGSAGVYFNDSTKIVLSADGTVFQYTERRRRDSSNGSEHSSQKHLITCYPPELQKKVTLLKHFRNYLVDQQKNSVKSDGADEVAQGLTGNPGLIKEGVISDGACASVKFGTSSTRYNSLEENNWQRSNSEGTSSTVPNSPSAMDDDADQEMPFLKKWVRTKHAILFRISNRTVQVVFYDRSEVLLSSEARVITYVSKQGQRSEHSLDDVLQTGRVDIAKRLKYTKDIMYRLINTQTK